MKNSDFSQNLARFGLKMGALALVLGLGLSGCDSQNSEKNASVLNAASAEKSANSSNLNESKPNEYIFVEIHGEKVKFKDSKGEFEINKNPKAVVYDYGVMDELRLLGESDKIIGAPVKNLPEYLSEFKDLPVGGSVVEPDFEAVAKLAPELIIINGRQLKYYDKFKEIAPVMYVNIDNTDYKPSFENKAINIARLYDKEELIKEKIAALWQRADALKSRINSEKKGIILMTNANKMSVFGPGSRFGIIHDLFGVTPSDKNLKIGLHGNAASPEYLLKINPDFIFVIDRNLVAKSKERAQEILNNDIVAQTNAAKTGKIIYLNPDFWYLSAGGVESLGLMIDEIEKAVF